MTALAVAPSGWRSQGKDKKCGSQTPVTSFLFLTHVRRPVFPQVIRDLRVGLRRPGEPSSSHTQAPFRQRRQAYADDESQVSAEGLKITTALYIKCINHILVIVTGGSLSLTSFCESQQCRPLARRERRYFAGVLISRQGCCHVVCNVVHAFWTWTPRTHG